MEYTRIRLERDAGVGRITLDQPPVNVMDIPMIREINHALEVVLSDESVRMVIFMGAGKNFSAGVDIKDHTREKVVGMLKEFHRIFRTLYEANTISLAVVHGHCLGGGCELVSFCDLAIATEDAVLGQPEIDVGCYPPVAAAHFPSICGPKKTMELLLTGRMIPAAEAVALGLVNLVVPTEELEKRTVQLVGNLMKKSSVVLRCTRKAILAATGRSFPEALKATESIYTKELIQTDDLAEGVAAFMEKREPNWTNS